MVYEPSLVGISSILSILEVDAVNFYRPFHDPGNRKFYKEIHNRHSFKEYIILLQTYNFWGDIHPNINS